MPRQKIQMKECSIQAVNNESNPSFLLNETESSILNTINKVIGKLFNSPSQHHEHHETDVIRSSRKSFKLNDPTAFHENLIQHRPYVPAKAILPPLSKTEPGQFITPRDEEEEVCCVEDENFVRVFTDDEKEIMKVYIDDDNEPPVRLVQSEESIWKMVPLRKCKHEGSEKTHFTGDDCKLQDPVSRGRQILTLQKLWREASLQKLLLCGRNTSDASNQCTEKEIKKKKTGNIKKRKFKLQ